MYWVELHIHTENGSLDSIMNLAELLEEYRRIGVDGVCVTEHVEWEKISFNQYEKLYSAFDYAEENNLDIDIFPGAEVKLKHGEEYLVYGIKIPYEWFGMDWSEMINKVHELGGIIIKSHPYRDEKQINPIDGIEKYNFCSNIIMNREACKFAKYHNALIEVVGCDAHSIDVAGMAITVLKKRPENGIELVQLLKKKEVESYIIKGKKCSEEELYETIFDSSNDCGF